MPNSYKDNTLKEELVIEHLIQYRKEFALLDPERELFLYPKNETGKYKFVCSTVRPTKVPYPELYNYKKCAKFIAEFIEFEELKPPNEFPMLLPGPNNVIALQIGDIFDISLVLCSLLIGAGYNAFVVYGKAPRFITTKDETNLENPWEEVKEERTNDGDNQIDEDLIPFKKPLISEYDERLKAKKAEEELRQQRLLVEIDDDQPEIERYDNWDNSRLYAWVYIKKSKRMSKSIYIEPATGREYSVEDPPFLTIDAMFNNHNFWINLENNTPAKDVDLNFLNEDKWEHVMIQNKDFNDDDYEEEDDHEDENKMENEYLDMPPFWPSKLYISKQKYAKKTPIESKTDYYRFSKVDRFADYSQIDGLVMRKQSFKDFARLLLFKEEYEYKYRMDKLVKKIKYPFEHTVVYQYAPGQMYGWKQITEIEGHSVTTDFYETNYETGLIRRIELFGKKILHYYKSRDDKIIENKVLISTDYNISNTTSKDFFLDNPNYLNKILITKFSQKFTINPLLPSEAQIQKLVYKMSDHTDIYVTYHFAPGKIIAKTDFFKDEEGDNGMVNEEKQSKEEKYNSEKDKLKKHLLNMKKESFINFSRIEDSYINNVLEQLKYTERINVLSKKENVSNEVKFREILTRNIFDDMQNRYFGQNKKKETYSEEDTRTNKIKFLIESEMKKLGPDQKPDFDRIKQNLINNFKQSRLDITKILQEELADRVEKLKKEMDEFRSKEGAKEKDIEDHDEKINLLQRHINVID